MTMLESGIVDELLGKIYIPADLSASISLPGRGVKAKYAPGEIGIVIAKQQRPIYFDESLIAKYETIWYSITHNERVDAGAAYQAQQVFAGGASPAAPSATVYFNVIAIANAALTKTKTDQSLGSASSGVTTNEFTTIGLSRATATSPVGGDYTAPSSLGGQFTQNVKKTFTASGTGTAQGAGLFNSTTVAGSILFVEDNFSSAASMVSADTLAVTIAVSN